MRNIKLTIQYDGTNYAGWQVQKNGRAIQDVIQSVLRKITGAKTNLTGSGRTDAGVHALAQAANFKTRSKIPLARLRMALNSGLPEDIKVTAVEEVPLRFNSQHDAKSKLYRYTIVNSDFVDPFLRHFAAKSFYRLDIGTMKKAAKYLVGRRDFASFRKKNGNRKSSVASVKKINVEKKGNLIYIDMEADGFLYNMARNIVGTLIEAGRGKIAAGDVKKILLKKDRRFSGPTMPAKGLCLVKVWY